MGKKWSMKERAGTTYPKQREKIYKQIQAYVRDVSGVYLSLPKCEVVFDIITQGAVEAALEDGAFQLNQALGRLERKELPAKTQRLPDGELVDIPARSRLVLNLGRTGKAVDEAIRRGRRMVDGFMACGRMPATLGDEEG